VVPEVDVEALVGRLLSWWWKRFRRTLAVPLAAERDAAGLEVIVMEDLLPQIMQGLKRSESQYES